MKFKQIIFVFVLMGILIYSCEEGSLVRNANLEPQERYGEFIELVKEKSACIVSDMNIITPEELVGALIGSGPNTPVVSNIIYKGANGAAGIFNDQSNVLGFSDGIVLSTGSINHIIGPNVSDRATMNNWLFGDTDLDALIPNCSTFDAAVLEFDFECATIQEISFEYVFSSEEYNEYINSSYNDVFGFFVNGINIACIPSTTIPVAINNLNCGHPCFSEDNYCCLFNNNDINDGGVKFDTEVDGFTVVLTATTRIDPGLNHIKLAIADAGDRVLDSHVLIKSESFICAPPGIVVDIDIKPGGEPNSVPCNKPNFGIPVAILSSADFDATTVDHTTVNLQGAYELHLDHKTGNMKRHEEDVDGDGDIDLVFHFKLGDTDLDCSSTEGTLTGETYDGIPITGFDTLNMIGS